MPLGAGGIAPRRGHDEEKSRLWLEASSRAWWSYNTSENQCNQWNTIHFAWTRSISAEKRSRPRVRPGAAVSSGGDETRTRDLFHAMEALYQN